MHTLLLHEKVKVYKDMLKFVGLNQIIEKGSFIFHWFYFIYCSISVI